MTNHEIDPWDKEELLAVRHAGTVYAGAVAIIAALHREAQATLLSSSCGSSFYLRMGLVFLLIGTAGSVAYQLLTISEARGKLAPLRTASACSVVVGCFGFFPLAAYVFTS
jgi:hypothetical protein